MIVTIETDMTMMVLTLKVLMHRVMTAMGSIGAGLMSMALIGKDIAMMVIIVMVLTEKVTIAKDLVLIAMTKMAVIFIVLAENITPFLRPRKTPR